VILLFCDEHKVYYFSCNMWWVKVCKWYRIRWCTWKPNLWHMVWESQGVNTSKDVPVAVNMW